jgi:hypothetical protein
MEELLKELLKKMLIDNLEIRIDRNTEFGVWDNYSRIKVSLVLFGEPISSDFLPERSK